MKQELLDVDYYEEYTQLNKVSCVLLGYYAASSVNSLPKFRDNLSFSSPSVKNTKRNSAQATQIQAKELIWGVDLREARIGVPRYIRHASFDRTTGHFNRHLII